MDSNTCQDELICSICKNFFLDLITIDRGDSFCKSCLFNFFEVSSNHPHRPLCASSSCQTDLQTDIAGEGGLFLSPSSEQNTCLIHNEKMDDDCEKIHDVLCLISCTCEGHTTPRHCSTDLTVREFRQKLLEQGSSLWKKIEEHQSNINRETTKIRKWQGYVNLRRRMIQAEYEKVNLLLCGEEKKHLEKLEEESKEIFQLLEDSRNFMIQQEKVLQNIYEELKEMYHQPDVKLLQNFEKLMKRSESVQMPQPVNPVLSPWPITELISRLKPFQVHIFLDHEGVTSHLPVFEDLKYLLFSHEHLLVSHSTTSKWFVSWGSKAFTFGKYYWEVDVAGCGNWAVGVCNDSWTKRKDMTVSSEGVFLLFSVKVNDQFHLFMSSPFLPQYVERPLGQMGIFLDYEGGIVSFVNVAHNTLICSFLSCSFSDALRPFLCIGPQ